MNKIFEILCLLTKVDYEVVENIYKKYGFNGVTEQVILPLLLLPAEERKNHCISDDYMQFMADHGATIHQESVFSYRLLAELALQRLSGLSGLAGFEHMLFDEPLPAEYKKYSIRNEDKAPITEACWNFFRANGMLLVQDECLKYHACAVIHKAIEDDTFFPYDSTINGRIKKDRAQEFCNELMSEAVDTHLAHINRRNWQYYSVFLHQNMSEWEWEWLFKVLRARGICNFFKRQKIKKIILTS